MENDRKKYLDITKGIAITLVVFQHACGSLYKSGIYADESLSNIISFIGTFHMPLFMILSGYCFSLAYYQDGALKKDRVRKRIINLILLYVFYSLLRYVLKMVFSSHTNDVINKKAIFLIPIDAIDELWYLWALIVLYLIMVAVIKYSKERFEHILIILCVLSAIYIIIGIHFPYSFDLIGRYLLWFNCGILVQMKGKDCTGIKILQLVTETVSVVCLYLAYYLLILPDVLSNIFSILIAILMSELCVKIGIAIGNLERRWDITSYIGRHTLEIYLLHVYLTAGSRIVIKRLDFNGIWNSWITILFLVLMGIVIPCYISMILKKVGLYRVFFRPYDYMIFKKKIDLS